MLETQQQQSFASLVSGASAEELIWMKGFLSGTLVSRKSASTVEIPIAGGANLSVTNKISILFGTETGNAKSLAVKMSQFAKEQGFVVRLQSLEQYRNADLIKEQILFIVVSTQGDGEPPTAARRFYEYLQDSGTSLSHLRYGVVALGDSGYPQFCKVGKDVHEWLRNWGGSAIREVQLCDVDYEEAAMTWFGKALSSLQNTIQRTTGFEDSKTSTKSNARKYYRGVVQRSVNLNDSGSEKCTHHMEICASQLEYEPGDSMGLVPENSPELVQQILSTVGLSSGESVAYRDEQYTLSALLQTRLNVSYLPLRVVKQYAALAGLEIPETIFSLLDLLMLYPLKEPQLFYDLLNILEPIVPRLYSISSAPSLHTDELHILVKLNTFRVGEILKKGHCSSYLQELAPGTEIRFYIHSNKQFRLAPPEKDMIMIGAGTGVAPFRSFVTERASSGATGRNWLFFGDQRFASDFMYQTEWQALKDAGVLSRINTAFSRDQNEKIYVQDKIRAEGKAIFEWLEAGAYVYVCGARDPMSKDVESALKETISKHGNMNQEQAQMYLSNLTESGRFLLDVY